MTLHIEILPAPQRAFWEDLAGGVPSYFVLYGGTAVALRYGHRRSIDFDFFTDRAFAFDRLLDAMPALAAATILDRRPDTAVFSMPISSGEVNLSFFGELSFGRVGDPDRVAGKIALASPLDLLATKLKTLHDRIEAKDYLDIEALLRSGLTLNQGIAAARALFGRTLNPLDTAKAVGWFKDGDLERKLTPRSRAFLASESAAFRPETAALPIRSRRLAPG